MRVILFDIDGTLIVKRSTDADERERFRRAVSDEVGKSPPTEPWHYDGMVDPQICRLLLFDVGLKEDAVSERLQRVIERVGEIYLAMEKRPVLNPGVDELLKTISVSQNHRLGVLTGNLSVVAEEKLRLTGIRRYFDEAFYSNGYFERADLVREALKTCVTKYRLVDNRSVVIVGDTPRDIEAARLNGAKAVAVATGLYSSYELAASGPDAVFDSLDPSRELLETVGM